MSSACAGEIEEAFPLCQSVALVSLPCEADFPLPLSETGFTAFTATTYECARCRCVCLLAMHQHGLGAILPFRSEANSGEAGIVKCKSLMLYRRSFGLRKAQFIVPEVLATDKKLGIMAKSGVFLDFQLDKLQVGG